MCAAARRLVQVRMFLFFFRFSGVLGCAGAPSHTKSYFLRHYISCWLFRISFRCSKLSRFVLYIILSLFYFASFGAFASLTLTELARPLLQSDAAPYPVVHLKKKLRGSFDNNGNNTILLSGKLNICENVFAFVLCVCAACIDNVFCVMPMPYTE